VAKLCKDRCRRCAPGRNPVIPGSTWHLHAVVVEANYTRDIRHWPRLTRQGRFGHVRGGRPVVDWARPTSSLAGGMCHTHIALRVSLCRMLRCVGGLSTFWPVRFGIVFGRRGKAARGACSCASGVTRAGGRGKRTARVARSKQLAYPQAQGTSRELQPQQRRRADKVVVGRRMRRSAGVAQW
jgi:hypothetical protein